MTDFVLARRLAALGRRPPVAGWDAALDALHAAAPLSRAATLVLCGVSCDAETRRVDLVVLLATTPGPETEARLAAFLGDASARVVGAALRALARTGTGRSLPALDALGAGRGALAERARRVAQAVRTRVGDVGGALSEPGPARPGALSVARRGARGRLSQPAPEPKEPE